ncbi:MAG: hypothetical protein IKR25_06910 [Muribaculaceae bacterium]|nr:hypothetical protein [Muribaculaceae bacterium]
MSRFINPFTDEGFKRIFGQEVSRLKDKGQSPAFIADVTGLTIEQINAL